MRRFSVRSESSNPSIPIIENLRSAVSSGVTTIRWTCEADKDIVFGIWFSTSQAFDLSRPPDDVQVALDGVAGYAIQRQQTGPEYVAVAALRDERRGTVSTLFLDWSTEAPRRPDDQVIIEKLND